MKSFVAIIAMAFVAFGTLAKAQEAIFITNARDVPVTEPDPPLTSEGRARAEKWAEVLRYAGVDAVFSVDRRRNTEMAEPLAKSLGVEVIQFPKYEVEALAERLKKDHANDRVFLSIGGNNVFPLMQALGFNEIMRSMRSEDITLVIPRPNDRPMIMLLQID